MDYDGEYCYEGDDDYYDDDDDYDDETNSFKSIIDNVITAL